ncbi:hypothetical protein [uncultured Dialister sp.]|uniref:hypothetical protein n=1 Tax=uncultured Dialister sp. TaxID=278064 RepID=UPI00261AD7A0|nr:hypothetical protein [uncultured Dialister sp.]
MMVGSRNPVRKVSVKHMGREPCRFTGNSFSVDMAAIGDKLQGAKVIHNHPDNKEYYGDCFSMNDFCTSFECHWMGPRNTI